MKLGQIFQYNFCVELVQIKNGLNFKIGLKSHGLEKVKLSKRSKIETFKKQFRVSLKTGCTLLVKDFILLLQYFSKSEDRLTQCAKEALNPQKFEVTFFFKSCRKKASQTKILAKKSQTSKLLNNVGTTKGEILSGIRYSSQ